MLLMCQNSGLFGSEPLVLLKRIEADGVDILDILINFVSLRLQTCF